MKHPYNKWANWRLGIIIPVFFLSHILQLQGQIYFSDARSFVLGGITSVSGITNFPVGNPASLGDCNVKIYSSGHTSPFLVNEIGVSSLGTVIPVNHGAFKFNVTNYGLKGYRIFSWETGYGLQLNKKLFAGVSFLFHHTVSQGEWNYLWSIGPAIGIIFHPFEKTTAGMFIQNPVSISNHSNYGPLQYSVITLGFTHIIYENTMLFTEISQFSSGNIQFKTGIEYKIHPDITLRTGYHTSPSTLSFGSAYKYGQFHINMGISYATTPCITPTLLIQYIPQ